MSLFPDVSQERSVAIGVFIGQFINTLIVCILAAYPTLLCHIQESKTRCAKLFDVGTEQIKGKQQNK